MATVGLSQEDETLLRIGSLERRSELLTTSSTIDRGDLMMSAFSRVWNKRSMM